MVPLLMVSLIVYIFHGLFVGHFDLIVSGNGDKGGCKCK